MNSRLKTVFVFTLGFTLAFVVNLVFDALQTGPDPTLDCVSVKYGTPSTFREGDRDAWECSRPWKDRADNIAQLYDLNYTALNIGQKCLEIGNGSKVDGIRCCDHSRARQWHLDHPNRKPPEAKRKLYLFVIREFSKAMASIKMPFHIMGGTLLGWQRECGIISHTMDIDFGIMEEDWNTTKIHNALYQHGFKYKGCVGYDGLGWELQYQFKQYSTVKFDLRQMLREEHFTFMSAGQMFFERHARWEGHYHIVPAEFDGIPIGVPNDVHRYLAIEFGRDYMEPNAEYNWMTGARNLVLGLPRWKKGLEINNRDFCTLPGGGYDKKARKNKNNGNYDRLLPP